MDQASDSPRGMKGGLFPEVAEALLEAGKRERKPTGKILQEALGKSSVLMMREAKEHQQYLEDIRHLKIYHAQRKHDYKDIEAYPEILAHETKTVYFHEVGQKTLRKIYSTAERCDVSISAYTDLLLRKHFNVSLPENKNTVRSLCQHFHDTNLVKYHLRLSKEQMEYLGDGLVDTTDFKARARFLTDTLTRSLDMDQEHLAPQVSAYLQGKKEQNDKLLKEGERSKYTTVYSCNIPHALDERVRERVEGIRDLLPQEFKENSQGSRVNGKRQRAGKWEFTYQKYAAFVLDMAIRDVKEKIEKKAIFGPQLAASPLDGDELVQGNNPCVQVNKERMETIGRVYGSRPQVGRVSGSSENGLIYHHLNGAHPPMQLASQEVPASVREKASLGSSVGLQLFFGNRLVDTSQTLTQEQRDEMEQMDEEYRTGQRQWYSSVNVLPLDSKAGDRNDTLVHMMTKRGLAINEPLTIERKENGEWLQENGQALSAEEAKCAEELRHSRMIKTKSQYRNEIKGAGKIEGADFIHYPEWGNGRIGYRFPLEVLPRSILDRMNGVSGTMVRGISLQIGENDKLIDPQSTLEQKLQKLPREVSSTRG